MHSFATSMIRPWLGLVALVFAVSAPRAAAAQPIFGDSEQARALVAAEAEYEAKKKNPWSALGFELLLPGAGNFYAGENEEALLTWTGLMLGGVFLADGYGLLCRTFSDDDARCKRRTFSLVQGWIFLVGSRLFGLTSAPTNVVRNNRALRARLGLDAPSFSVAPWVSPASGGFELALRW